MKIYNICADICCQVLCILFAALAWVFAAASCVAIGVAKYFASAERAEVGARSEVRR